jgi:hypothetical protein
VIASVMPGEAVVEVETAQYARFQQSTIIRSGAETDLGTLRLRSKVSVSGSIVYPSGISVQRPFVFAYLVDPRTDSTDPRQPITATCQDNAFRFDKLDPGNYIVGWEAPSVQPRVKSVREGSINGWRYVDARSGDAAGVRIELTEQMARDAQQQRPH